MEKISIFYGLWGADLDSEKIFFRIRYICRYDIHALPQNIIFDKLILRGDIEFKIRYLN